MKYEEVYLKEYNTPPTVIENLGHYFKFHNDKRYHQALDYRTPAAVHFATAA